MIREPLLPGCLPELLTQQVARYAEQPWQRLFGNVGQPPPRDLASDFPKQVRPLLQKYCLGCHSTKTHKGDLDLERFTSLESARKDLHPWQQVADQVEIGEMPPKGKPRPSGEERKTLLGLSGEPAFAPGRRRPPSPSAWA